MKTMQYAFLGLAGLTLAACDVSSDGNNVTGDQPDWNRYEEHAAEAQAFADGLDNTTRLAIAPTQDSASMSGTFRATSGGIPAALVGEMDMEADFGAETVEGQLYNAFLDYGSTHDPLSGTLDYSGSVVIDPDPIDTAAANDTIPDGTDIDANGSASQATSDGTTYNIFLDLFGDVHEVASGDPLNPITGVDGLLEGNVTVSTVNAEGVTVTDPTVYDLDGTFIVYEDE